MSALARRDALDADAELRALAHELFSDLGARAEVRWLVVAAHPDDETIGATWVLSRSDSAVVLHVTDGAPEDRALWPPEAPGSREGYARLRSQEVRAALALAGVGPERVHRLGFADQKACLALAELSLQVAEVLAAQRPDIVLVHPYEGGHPDHDAAAFAVRAAALLFERTGVTGPRIAEMTSYHRLEGQLRTGVFLPVRAGSSSGCSGPRSASRRRACSTPSPRKRGCSRLSAWGRSGSAPPRRTISRVLPTRTSSITRASAGR